jgi:tetratricopeptide (TPR) repeat protein
MANRQSKNAKIEIPFLLSEAVKSGRAILFLGAGASKECKNANGDTPPNGDQLRDIISKKYFGKLMPNRTLAAVAEMAIESGAGANLVFQTVSDAFDGFETSEAHKIVSDFNWQAIATTNYDTFLESAYSDPKRRRQTLIPFVKDDEPVEEKMRSALNSLLYLKLHGCLNHRFDNDIPLVLAWEEYSKYSKNRTRLFGRLKDLSHESTIIFVGYGMGDSHIRDLFHRLDSRKRPRWYIVDPTAEREDIDFWAAKNFDVFPNRFGEFIVALDNSIPKLLRFVTPSRETVKFPLRSFYIAPTDESDHVRQSLLKDVTLLHASMPHSKQSPKDFYSGYDTGWGCIINRLDARRKVTDDILFKALLENEAPSEPIFFLLRGPAGAGKTIALKRAAFDAATANNALVFWLEDSGQLRPEVFFEIADLTQRPIYIFVDQVAVHVDKLLPFLSAMKARRLPLVLIGAEREADWSIYCGQLEELITPNLVRIGHLSLPEVEDLLDLLERHDCLGELKGKSRAEQIDAFMAEERANRQLLVALHVLTRGQPFEKIVLDEYERVSPEQARHLYLDIATMNQFGVPVRAGTITRASGIQFSDYEAKFFEPLKGMIAVGRDIYTGDRTYKTRHARVAQILFKTVCYDDAAKIAQFIRLIEGFDVGYSSDRRALEGICRGRSLAENFNSVDSGRQVYQTAVRVAPMQAYLYQQWAIFESTHPSGSFSEAEALAETASSMEPKNRVFIHTQAEVARKRANHEGSPIIREQLRRKTRAFLDKMPRADRFAVSTRCKLLVDEISDLSDSFSERVRESEDKFFAEKLKDTEAAIACAQQDYPDDAEMFETEARLWSELRDNERALKALERAWKKVPRGSGTAIRIGKIYAQSGNFEQQYSVLREALSREPDDKAIHFAMAMHLLEKNSSDLGEIESHLISSFSESDLNFEARYMFAQFLFLRGKVDKVVELFDEINKRAPASFRRIAPRQETIITARLPSYSGTIEAIREGYCFIRCGIYPARILAHRSAFDEETAELIDVGQAVEFRMRFNRSGPVATEVRSKP